MDRPTTVRELALGIGYEGTDGQGAVCLSKLIVQLGPAPRPFYVIGHNPNTIEDVVAALDAGANAIEPDVNIFADSPSEVCISHNRGEGDAPPLRQYLSDLRDVALAHPELALVVFDCKEPVATSEHGWALLSAIRELLTPDTDLNVIISVGSRQLASIFDDVKGDLRPREGVMIDADNSPAAVSEWTFANVANQCYGNGITEAVRNSVFSPHVRPSVELACGLKAGKGQIKFIYTWCVGFDDPESMREYIRIGVDGIIAGYRPEKFDAVSVGVLRTVISEVEFRKVIRLATREDNPFAPSNAAYALYVQTGNDGTDANVTFTLTGEFGRSTKTVNTRLVGRMEQGERNVVTVPSADLGGLRSITVQRDNEGNAPDWYVEQIEIISHRYGAIGLADFNTSLSSTNPIARPVHA